MVPALGALAAPTSPSFQPLYVQIKGLLTQSLEKGEWHPGQAIPSELELADRFNVSQGTVRKAIDALAGEHMLVRRQGKGTFVATHTEARSSTFRFLRIRAADGTDPYPDSKIIEVTRSRASAELARHLDLRSGDAVVQVKRVLSYNGEPVVLDDISLPANLFKGLTIERYEAWQGSLYGFFEREFGVRMLRATEHVKAVAADPFTAETLRVGIGAPLLAVDRVTYTFGDKPVEFRRGLCSTRNHFYLNELG